MRADHVGKRTRSLKVEQDEEGIGCRRREVGGALTDVLFGEKGDEVDGVRSAFRLFVIESSIVLRESRRKSRNKRVLKQNCGLKAGAGVAWDMIRIGGVRDIREDSLLRSSVLILSLTQSAFVLDSPGCCSLCVCFQNHASLILYS